MPDVTIWEVLQTQICDIHIFFIFSESKTFDLHFEYKLLAFLSFTNITASYTSETYTLMIALIFIQTFQMWIYTDKTKRNFDIIIYLNIKLLFRSFSFTIFIDKSRYEFHTTICGVNSDFLEILTVRVLCVDKSKELLLHKPTYTPSSFINVCWFCRKNQWEKISRRNVQLIYYLMNKNFPVVVIIIIMQSPILVGTSA